MSSSGKFEVESLSMSAFGDRLLIEEDQFRSGYECAICNGTGKTDCDNCSGEGVVSYDGKVFKRCGQCSGSKTMICSACSGKGGLLIVPEDAQRRPTTGRIVSTGELVKALVPGQSVLYSSFAGHTIDLYKNNEKVILRILHEPEILCLVEGHLDLRRVRGKSEIASLQN